MKKNIIIILIVVLAAAAFIFFSDIRSTDDYYLSHIDDIKKDSETVFLSIKCDTLLQNPDIIPENLKAEGILPKDGVVLPKTEYVLRKEDTVFNILERAARYNKIQLEYKKLPAVYIKSINHLYEFDCGPLSGWLYRVNSEFSNGDCNSYILSDKDEIEWVYTCDLGRDVGQEDEEGRQ